MTPDSAAVWIVLGVAAWMGLLLTALVERWQRRERRRVDAMHHCRPGCGCRGSIEGRTRHARRY